MSRLHDVRASFAAGELSEQARQRVDASVYQASAKRIRNLTVRLQGGVEMRHGTRHVELVGFQEIPELSDLRVRCPYQETPLADLLVPTSIEESTEASITAVLDHPAVDKITITIAAEALVGAAGNFRMSANKQLSIAKDALESTGEVKLISVDDSQDDGDKLILITGSITAGTARGPIAKILRITEND